MTSSSLLEALLTVEALPPSASGALLVGDAEQPAGMIFVERNRVCWAAAAGMRRRLFDILRSHFDPPLSDEAMATFYTRCKREGRPLGETLVAEGLVSADHLRAALKQHTVESLLALEQTFAGEAWPLSWQEHAPGIPLNPRFTFPGAEIIAAVGAGLIDDTTIELLEDHLSSLDGGGGALCAFDADEEGAPIFVGVHGVLTLPLDDLCDLAAWAGAALEASPGFSAAVTHACAHSADGGTVAWIYEGWRCAAICPSRQALQKLVTTLDNWSLAMVLATRLSVLERVRGRSTLAAG